MRWGNDARKGTRSSNESQSSICNMHLSLPVPRPRKEGALGGNSSKRKIGWKIFSKSWEDSASRHLCPIQSMNIARIALNRHTCKAYDPSRRIPSDQVEQLKTLLRYAPSSVNSQPWHFLFADTEAAKARIAKATPIGSPYAANNAKINNASHVIVLAARADLGEAHLAALIAQEEKDGRFPTPEGRETQKNGRNFYVGLHRDKQQDVQTWTQKQVYLALGTLLLGAATLEIDATPIEGFDPAALDEELGLAAKGLKSAVLVALGYRSAEDFNARLPKSRLPLEAVISAL